MANNVTDNAEFAGPYPDYSTPDPYRLVLTSRKHFYYFIPLVQQHGPVLFANENQADVQHTILITTTYNPIS